MLYFPNMSYIDSRDGEIADPICDALYWEPLIPRFDLNDEYLMILSSLEFAILLFYVFVLVLKKYWIVLRGHVGLKKAKQLLLPYYDRIVYYYAFISFIRLSVGLCSYILAVRFNIESVAIHSAIEALSNLGIISIALFIALLFMQNSVGQNAFRRATIRTAYICAFIFVLMFFRAVFSKNNGQRTYEWLSLCIHSSLLAIYVSIFGYSFCIQRYKKHMKRERNRILYRYLSCVCCVHIFYVTAWILELSLVDGFCFLIFGEYAVRIVFPVVAFWTIKSDSQFWKRIIYALQFVSNSSMTTNDENDDNSREIRMNTMMHRHEFDAKSDEMLLRFVPYRDEYFET